jgi:hypothetical protein
MPHDDTTMTGLTAERLSALLRAAETAHGEYEKMLGHADVDWPAWYATYIIRELNPPESRYKSRPNG